MPRAQDDHEHAVSAISVSTAPKVAAREVARDHRQQEDADQARDDRAQPVDGRMLAEPPELLRYHGCSLAGTATARLRRVALTGKRILMTGGAGFIGTSLARRLVADNELVVLDNLRRNSLTRAGLAEHPNLELRRATSSTLDAGADAPAARDHVVHMAAIAGVDTVIESPVRTMRVNLIGTMNVLEAAHDARASSSGWSTSRPARSSAARVPGRARRT